MIIDIIITQSKWTKKFQTHLILDREVEFIYKKVREEKNYIFYESLDNDIYSALCHDPGSRDSFGGRRLEFKTETGVLISNGDVWESAVQHSGLMGIGFATINQLNECYVFCAGTIKKWKVHHWLKHNKPSSNYYKYRK